MILEVCWGVLLAGLCFWIAADGSTLRGIIAVIIAMLFVSVCAAILAVYFAALSVVRKAVTDARIGQIVFESLFEHVLGVSDQDSDQHSENVGRSEHQSAKEVEQTFNDAASSILSMGMPSTNSAGLFFWLAERIQRIAVWATVNVIVKSCSRDGTSVSLLELRDRLAPMIDNAVVSYLKQFFTRLALTIISCASSVMILVAYGIRLLPI